MACSKLTTAIINRTEQALILRVGNQNCFAKLATVGVGGQHKVEIDVNWTYQEFSLEPAAQLTTGATLQKLIVNSDDCCDFERITVTQSGGTLQADKIPRGKLHGADGEPCITWRSYFSWPKLNWRFWLWTRDM
jgi:VCBS repeat-containing protein